MAVLLVLVGWIFWLYSLAIIARTLLPWFRVSYYHPVMRFLIQITEPILAPLRRRIRPTGGIDFTPMAALLVLWIVQMLVDRLLRTLIVLLP